MSNQFRSNPPLKVCYFGTFRDEYPRNQILIEGLRRAGTEVIEVHSSFWHGIDDRVRLASGGWLSANFLWRTLRVYLNILKKYFSVVNYDVMVVGYPGQFDIFLARILTWLRRKPLCWDMFASVYLISLERKLDQKSPLTIKAIRFIEKLACRLPERIILESKEYVDWIYLTHQVKSDRFRLVPLGTMSGPLIVIGDRSIREKGKFIVLYWGNFLRGHGVDLIVEAASHFQDDESIEFRFVGEGPEREKVMLAAQGLKNVSFPGYLSDEALRYEQEHADVCLGVFGHTPQAMMTIQNRLYECLAKGEVLLTGYSPLVGRTFQHGKDLYLCDRSVNGIVEAIGILRENPQLRAELAENGPIAFQENFSVEKIGQRFLELLLEIV
jgi:glycosyltransferase involved in cell wall biosynthesis